MAAKKGNTRALDYNKVEKEPKSAQQFVALSCISNMHISTFGKEMAQSVLEIIRLVFLE